MMKKIARVLSMALVFPVMVVGCATDYKKTEKEMKQPINCATAAGDIRSLHHEKAHVSRQIEMGVSMIMPVSAVVGLVKGTEGTKYRVATGEYNKAIDNRIAEIKNACGELPEMVYYSLDTDMNGRVTKEELCALYTSEVVCAEKFTYFDQNKNGFILEEEFVEAY